jgi:hypothetical protein
MSRDADLRSLREEQGFKMLLNKLTACVEKSQNGSEDA